MALDNKIYYLSAFNTVLGAELELGKDGKVKIKEDFENNTLKTPRIEIFFLKLLDEILSEESVRRYYENPFLKKNLIDKFIHKIIDGDNNANKIDDFIDNLQLLSNKTYERTPCNMSFIIFQKSVKNFKDEVNKLQFEFIPLEKKTHLKEIVRLKDPLKLIDSKSLSYVVSNDYLIVGLAKKIKSQKSVYEKMTNRHSLMTQQMIEKEIYDIGHSDMEYSLTEITLNLAEKLKEVEDEIKQLLQESKKEAIKFSVIENVLNRRDALRNTILELQDNKEYQELLYSQLTKEDEQKISDKDIHFVQISANKIEWFIEDDIVCVLSNGKWKIQNYKLILNVLSKFLKDTTKDRVNELNQNKEFYSDEVLSIFELFNHVKRLASKNIGALIVILNKGENESAVFNKLLTEKKLKTDDYRKIVKDDMHKSISILNCDKFLFELVSSLDGATIFNHNLNIIGFGEFIDNTKRTKGGIEQFSGSRTIAASRASEFGLSIKISEDGDVSIYYEGKLLLNT